MKEVNNLNVCNVNLEYHIDDYVYIYNPKNERMIQADQNTLEYLRAIILKLAKSRRFRKIFAWQKIQSIKF